MTLDKVNQDLANALKSGDKATTEALRLLKSALINARIKLGHELSEDEFVATVRKEIKLRVEARDMFAQNNRAEQAAKEEFERRTYSNYVPAEMGEPEIIDIINRCAGSLGSDYNFSQLMPMVMKQVAGKADGRLVSELVKKHIEQRNNSER